MVDLPWHFLNTWSSNGVMSQIFAVQSGLFFMYLAWRMLRRLVTRILTTTGVLATAAFLFTHPVDLTQPVPPGPPVSPYFDHP